MFPGWLELERKTAVEQKVEKVEPFFNTPRNILTRSGENV